MSSFTTPLIVEKLNGGRYWRVVQEFTYRIGADGSPEHIDIPADFVTDFGSIPRPFWNMLSPTGKPGKAYVIHDGLYQGKGIQWEYSLQPPGEMAPPIIISRVRQPTRKEADDILFEAMGVLGVNGVTKRIVYWGVRVGGWAAWDQNRKEAA